MLCPLCNTTLEPLTYERANIHACNQCGGEFIGPEQLHAIINRRESVFGEELHRLLEDHQPIFGVPAQNDERDLECPACQGSMQLVNYAGDSGIAIDRCEECGGLWLDHEELEKIQLIMEKYQDHAPAKLNAIAGRLEEARREMARKTCQSFSHSRFSFVNAVINRLLDAA